MQFAGDVRSFLNLEVHEMTFKAMIWFLRKESIRVFKEKRSKKQTNKQKVNGWINRKKMRSSTLKYSWRRAKKTSR